jgi:type IV pilus assembly protein PilF
MRCALSSLRLAGGTMLAGAMLSGCQTTTTVTNAPVSAAASPSLPTPEQDAGRRAGIRLKLATSYFQNRQYSVAIEEANRALQIDPSLAAAHGLLAIVYMTTGDRPAAESSFQRALRLAPDDGDLLNNYGWFLCQTGRQRQAIEQFQRAANVSGYATPGMALQNAGVCLMQVNDTAGAENFLKRSFETDAGNPITQFHLARLYLRMGRLDRAGFFYDVLQRGVEPNAEVLFLGVRLAHANGNLRQERQLADELARRYPTSIEAERVQRGQFDD